MPWPPDRNIRRAVTVDGMVYEPGQSYRVIREGAYLSGWQQSTQGNYQTGWRRDLAVGDVIVCAGFGAGWGSDPGFGVEFRDPEVGLVEFQPLIGGPFNYRPEPGYLEVVDA